MLVRLTRSQIERVLEALAVALDGEQWTIFQHYDAVRARNQLRAALTEAHAPVTPIACVEQSAGERLPWE